MAIIISELYTGQYFICFTDLLIYSFYCLKDRLMDHTVLFNAISRGYF